MSPLPALALFSVFATLVLVLPVGAIRFSDRGGVDGIDLASLPENLAVPLRNADQHSRWTRSTAVLAAFAAAIVVGLASPRTAPGAFGLVGLTVLLLGERRSPVVTTATRTAVLAPRRVRDYLPRRAALVPIGVMTVLAFFALGVPTASSSPGATPPPEHSTVLPAGSYLSGTSTDSNGDTLASIFCPWPGAHFLAPIMLTLVAQLALAAVGLRTVAAREQVSTSRDDGLDTVLRRRSSEGIVGFLLVALALPLPLFGHSMVEAATWRVAEWDYLRGTVGGLGILVAVGCMAAGVGLLIRRTSVVVGPRRHDPAPAGADLPSEDRA